MVGIGAGLSTAQDGWDRTLIERLKQLFPVFLVAEAPGRAAQGDGVRDPPRRP
jgi:hypothetical protein